MKPLCRQLFHTTLVAALAVCCTSEIRNYSTRGRPKNNLGSVGDDPWTGELGWVETSGYTHFTVHGWVGVRWCKLLLYLFLSLSLPAGSPW